MQNHSSHRRLARAVSAAALALLASACSSSPATPGPLPDGGAGDAEAPPPKCNGSVANCALRYDQVTQAATHNAFSYAYGGKVHYTAPNQERPIPDQLAYGIRALGIRPCPYFGEDPAEKDRVYVTHNSDLKGQLGTEPLVDILNQVRVFLEANPGEVITLLAESTVTPAQVAGAFAEAKLAPYLYTHDPVKGWPTLREMIDAGTRLVVFNDSQDADRPQWQEYMWDFIVDTDYNITNKDQFSCKFYRGKPENDLYFINQFIYADFGNGIVVPDEGKAAIANELQFAFGRSVGCWRETGRIPNFVYVDMYQEGDVIGAVECLNRLPRGVPAADAACAPKDADGP